MSDALQERYAGIERQYSEGQWQEVLINSAALLAELPDRPDEPLRTRLTLLQGHTLLYGLGQIAEAAAIYRQVLDHPAEPVLQSIAAQELEHCLAELDRPQPPATTAAATGSAAAEAFPFSAAPVGQAPTLAQMPAMPWLEALGDIDPARTQHHEGAAAAQPPWLQSTPEPAQDELREPIGPTIDPAIADVIDEPDQLEVHQADPERAELIDLVMAAVTDEEPEPTVTATQGRWSPAEEAELARGILTVELR